MGFFGILLIYILVCRLIIKIVKMFKHLFSKQLFENISNEPKLTEIEIQKCVTRGIQESNRDEKICLISIQAFIFKAVKDRINSKRI